MRSSDLDFDRTADIDLNFDLTADIADLSFDKIDETIKTAKEEGFDPINPESPNTLTATSIKHSLIHPRANELLALRFLKGMLIIAQNMGEGGEALKVDIAAAWKKYTDDHERAADQEGLRKRLNGAFVKLIREKFDLPEDNKLAYRQLHMAKDIGILLETHPDIVTTHTKRTEDNKKTSIVDVKETSKNLTISHLFYDEHFRDDGLEQWLPNAEKQAGFKTKKNNWLRHFFKNSTNFTKLKEKGVAALPSARWLPTPANLQEVTVDRIKSEGDTAYTHSLSFIRIGTPSSYEIRDEASKIRLAKAQLREVFSEKRIEAAQEKFDELYEPLLANPDLLPLTGKPNITLCYQSLLSPIIGEIILWHKDNNASFVHISEKAVAALREDSSNTEVEVAEKDEASETSESDDVELLSDADVGVVSDDVENAVFEQPLEVRERAALLASSADQRKLEILYTNAPINKASWFSRRPREQDMIRREKINRTLDLLTPATLDDKEIHYYKERFKKRDAPLLVVKQWVDRIKYHVSRSIELEPELSPKEKDLKAKKLRALESEIHIRLNAAFYMQKILDGDKQFRKLDAYQKQLMLSGLEFLTMGAQSLSAVGCKSARDRTGVFAAVVNVMVENPRAMHDWGALMDGMEDELNRGHHFRSVLHHHPISKYLDVHRKIGKLQSKETLDVVRGSKDAFKAPGNKKLYKHDDEIILKDPFPGHTRVGNKELGKNEPGLYGATYRDNATGRKSLIKQDNNKKSGVRSDKVMGEAVAGGVLSGIYKAIGVAPTQYAETRLICVGMAANKLPKQDNLDERNIYLQSVYIKNYQEDYWKYAYREHYKSQVRKELDEGKIGLDGLTNKYLAKLKASEREGRDKKLPRRERQRREDNLRKAENAIDLARAVLNDNQSYVAALKHKLETAIDSLTNQAVINEFHTMMQHAKTEVDREAAEQMLVDSCNVSTNKEERDAGLARIKYYAEEYTDSLKKLRTPPISKEQAKKELIHVFGDIKVNELKKKPNAWMASLFGIQKERMNIPSEYIAEKETFRRDFAAITVPRLLVSDFGVHSGNFGVAKINGEERLVALDFGAAFCKLLPDVNLYERGVRKTGTPYYKNHLLEFTPEVNKSLEMAQKMVEVGLLKEEYIAGIVKPEIDKLADYYDVEPIKKFCKRLEMPINKYEGIEDKTALLEIIREFMTDRLASRQQSLKNQGMMLLLEHCYRDNQEKGNRSQMLKNCLDLYGTHVDAFVFSNAFDNAPLILKKAKNAKVFKREMKEVVKAARISQNMQKVSTNPNAMFGKSAAKQPEVSKLEVSARAECLAVLRRVNTA